MAYTNATMKMKEKTIAIDEQIPLKVPATKNANFFHKLRINLRNITTPWIVTKSIQFITIAPII